MKSEMNNNSLSILIAEDSRTQAEQLSFLLEQHGYRVTIAANGKQALLAAQAQKPILIISDIVMPEMDGYELCKAIKSDEKLKDTPVILVTTLSDSQDVIRGLECGADNFIRKPYDKRYLLSRINYLLMNLDMRKEHKMQVGVEINLGGQKYFINSERQQILDLLISTYEQAVHINNELKLRETELAYSNQVLNGLYNIAAGLNHALTEREVAEAALELALELPGIQAGWISLREGESGFRLAAARGLPPALSGPDALNGSCTCRRKLLSGELDHVTNILECERLGKAQGDIQGLRLHASVPLWLGSGHNTLGVMNLAGSGDKLFDEEELKVLYNVGNQVAVALERARLHEHLEHLVEERTRALTAEIAERKQTMVQLNESNERFRQISENISEVFWMTDLTKNEILFISMAYEVIWGRTVDSLYASPQNWINAIHIDDRQHVLQAALTNKIAGLYDEEYRIVKPDGSVRWVHDRAFPVCNSNGEVYRVVGVAEDITLRKENEKRIMRLNRIYSVLSGINITIVRVHDEDELFREACRIAVEQGGFTFAWIGKLDATSRQVTPGAQAGRDDGYLAQINWTAREDIPGNCALTAQALTEAKPVICNDIASDERMAAWRGEALSRDYRSVVVLPLILEGKPVGVFVLYAAETGVFDSEEMKLLVEMSGDISFALGYFSREAQRKLAESKVAEQFEELRRWHDATLGREMRTIELKREVNELLGQAGQPPRYPSAEAVE